MTYSEFDSYNYLQCAAGVTIGRYFWTTAVNFNALYRIDIDKWNIEEVATFSKDILGVELYIKEIVNIGTKLYIIPGRANNIAVFDLKDYTLSYIYLKDGNLCDGCKFGSVMPYGKDIYLFPQWLCEDKIVKINTENDTISSLRLPKKLLDGKKGKGTFLFGNKCDNIAWITLGNRGGFAKFDFETERLQLYDINNSDNFFIDILHYQKKLYLLSWKNQIIEFDYDLGKTKIIWEETDVDETYCRIVRIDNFLWLIPLEAKKIVKININDGIVENLHLSNRIKKFRRRNRNCAKFMDYSIIDHKIYLWPFAINTAVILDDKDLTLQYRALELPKKKTEQLKNLYLESGFTLDEDYLSVNDYLQDILHYNRNNVNRKSECIGKKIYNCL